MSYLIDLVGHYAMTVDDELGDQIAGSPFELFIVGGVSSAPHSVPRRLDLTTAPLTPLWLHLLWLYSLRRTLDEALRDLCVQSLTRGDN